MFLGFSNFFQSCLFAIPNSTVDRATVGEGEEILQVENTALQLDLSQKKAPVGRGMPADTGTYVIAGFN